MVEIARILLSVVFTVAGVTKLLDLEGSRRAIVGFGLRDSLARPLGLALPLAELSIAGGLLLASSARYAAAAATALLVVFCAAILLALARGRTPDCHCFGQLHSAPAGWTALGRNGTLAALATWVAIAPSTTVSWRALAVAAGGVAVVAQGLLWVALLRRYGAALHRIDELESSSAEGGVAIGDVAPSFTLPTVDGGDVSLGELLAAARPVLLVFTDTNCGACTALLPDLATWQRERADLLTVAIGHGDADLLRAAAQEHGLTRLLVAPDHSLARAYGSYGTPSAVLVADGRVASPVLYGAAEIALVIAPDQPVQDAEELVGV